MEKEFISYEEALALKELGFNEPCLFVYNQDDENKLMTAPQLSSYQINTGKNSDIGKINKVTAPFYQQAFKWFRKVHNLHGFIENSCIMNDNNYNCFINATDQSVVGLKSKRLFNMYNFKTYEEAELECLKKLIEIVKTK